MSSRTANTTANIPAASSGPRQLSTTVSLRLLSDMAEKLLLILAVSGDRLWRYGMQPVPNPVKLSQAAAQFLRDLRPHLDRRLGTPAPSPRKLIEIFAICAITANREPFALRQTHKQTEVSRTQCEAQFAFPLQSARKREPFIFGTLSRHLTVVQIGDWSDFLRNGKYCCLVALPQPKEHRSRRES